VDNRNTELRKDMSTIGLIGAGKIGSGLARMAIGAGHHVVLSNSRGPESLADLVAGLGERARAATPAQAALAGDLIVVSLPLYALQDETSPPRNWPARWSLTPATHSRDVG
jgi:8-hydroxy-5-deazaflavin:NADPH oxidoreductase